METKFVIPTLEGVTVALVVFLLACLAWPHLVKNKTHWYIAFMAVIGIILLQTASTMFAGIGSSLLLVFGAITGLLQIVGLVMLVLAVGGLTPKELRADMMKTIEVIRRGDERKEVIVPVTGERPAPRAVKPTTDEEHVVYSIDPEPGDVRIPTRAPSPVAEKPTGPIPLE